METHPRKSAEVQPVFSALSVAGTDDTALPSMKTKGKNKKEK